MKIGDRIKFRREQLEMSQDELANKLGYKSRSSITKIEKDASGLPQTKIFAIATALKTTPAYIMGWEKTEKKADIISDVALRMKNEPEFLELIELQVNLDETQIKKVKQLLTAFLQ